ncbi:nuclear transport factor 2 family protein [Streptomyces sp. NPDC059479]|uniref:nuclear transport factor 2 family protein n=1 Tax=Streptomyces sp. NPDC059479 TaxID=3346848 RepID=UPI0036ABA9A4
MNTSIGAPAEASVVAGVQFAIAAYAQALDADRTDDIAALFLPDGVAEIAGVATFEGREAIREGYAAFAPARPQLHLTANTVITSWTEDEATAVSNLAFFQRGESGWAVQLVGRYDDTLRRQDGTWRFQRRITTFLP